MHIFHINQEPLQLVIVSFILVTWSDILTRNWMPVTLRYKVGIKKLGFSLSRVFSNPNPNPNNPQATKQ